MRSAGLVLLALSVLDVSYLRAEEESKASTSEITHREDMVYGRILGAALVADVAYPKSDEPLPVILSVHGGRWIAGHKRNGSVIKVRQWAELGFFAMSIDYRLV